jgi:hypothetical protein
MSRQRRAVSLGFISLGPIRLRFRENKIVGCSSSIEQVLNVGNAISYVDYRCRIIDANHCWRFTRAKPDLLGGITKLCLFPGNAIASKRLKTSHAEGSF